ncbi:MAG: hypothetical protein VKJ05_05955 [Synechococcaceae cyanobacterium]|nr:hypothetical protein [Synechococcaceae cyanobacterium]
MPSPRKPPRSTAAAAPSAASAATRERRDALVVKLQIAAAVFGPMLLLGVWLQSQGFFGSPGL